LWILLIPFQARGIYSGDSGDLVTASCLGGVPHPPGYPLYSLLGWIVCRLPLFTAAWRVGLLSSLPHAAASTLVALVVWKRTGEKIFGIFSSLALVGNYVFFLYSVTPEVFALLDFFLVALTYLVYRWRETGNDRFLLGASFVFGLALSHHHMILFFVPAMGYWVWKTIAGEKCGNLLDGVCCTRVSAFSLSFTCPLLLEAGAL